MRNQLLRTQGGGAVELSNQTEIGHAQSGPIHPYVAIINLGNQGEHYSTYLDRIVHDSIALSTRVNAMQSALTHTWEGGNLSTSLPSPSFIKPSCGLGYRIDPI